MSFWLRELVGWFLLVVSLMMIGVTYLLCERRAILELWPWTVLTIFVFRGSIHLLKVAVAARVCQQTQDRLYPAADPAAPRRANPLPLARKHTGIAEPRA
jgi:hypothetical protein